jgi:hypothetical protein
MLAHKARRKLGQQQTWQRCNAHKLLAQASGMTTTGMGKKLTGYRGQRRVGSLLTIDELSERQHQ